MADLDFLRPWWLLLLVLTPLVVWLWRRRQRGTSGWDGLIPHPLLSPLMPASRDDRPRGKGWWPALLLLIAALALAGPSWREAPNPLGKQPDSLVIALDLSLSMLANDVSPDRLTRAKQKIRDLLPERADAFTGLVAYAGDAHVVTPLTDDRRTVENLLPPLDPFIMPARGSRADRAVARAIELLDQGGRGSGTVMLVTDGVDRSQHGHIRDLLNDSGYGLRILAVGTAQGGPIPIPERGFLRDQGELVTPRLDMEALEDLTGRTGGRVAALSLSNADLEQLGVTDSLSLDAEEERLERQLHLAVDDGYWLVWLLLPLGLLAWRRGGLAVVALAVTLPLPQTAQAFEWQDLWQRADQQGAELFDSNPEAAAEVFSNPAWQGSAHYRAGDYEAAAEAFARAEGAGADYNRGNALARAGELQAAIEAYEQALEADPGHADARANKALVEDLLEQQEQQQQQQDGEGDDSSQQEQNGDSSQQSSGGDDQQDGNEGGQQGQSGQDPQDSPPQPSGSPRDETEGDEGEEQAKEESPTEGEPEPGDEDSGSRSPPQGGLLSDPEAQDERSREQWMRRVPDDPGGLLRRKFLYQYQNNTPETEEAEPW